MVKIPHLSTSPVGRMLVVVYSHRAPFAPNYIGAHSPSAIAFRPFGATNANGLFSAPSCLCGEIIKTSQFSIVPVHK
ncbi:MAG: hypothetical protein PF436_09685, partial [Prolixibacteraceae bacterium]|nr:hypothetical protein [Prolixibacteraceae bacterium]